MTAYYVNVADWSPEQVADWMRGLDDTLLPYIRDIVEQDINGHRLLSTIVEDLPILKIEKLGHQEIFMGAVDLLREFHYNLDRENLQFLAMQLGCKARSLYNELRTSSQSTGSGKSEQVTTSTLAAVADIIDGVKDLVSWLDRAPFDGQEPYLSVKAFLLKICLELATNAQRDLFAEHPVEVIRQGCISLAGITDKIVCEFVDPLVLQPASLDVATVKKKPEEDLVLLNNLSICNGAEGLDLWIQGMLIQTSYKGVHVIGGVKFQSPAHQCGKIEEGDEVVQVNYQTVVGWQQKKLVAAMLENTTKVILTLKKRPRHSNNFGQIYVKPYRLPSKKRDSYHFRWHLTADGQTKPDLHAMKPNEVLAASVPSVQIAPPTLMEVTSTELPSEVESDNDTDDDSFLPDNHHHDPAVAAAAAAAVAAATGTDGNSVVSPASVRLILPKNRLSIQRRATVTGASPTSSRPPINIEQFWKELKEGQGQRGKAPELFDLLVQQQHLHLEQRPHSSMGHYSGLPRNVYVRQTDWNANHECAETTEEKDPPALIEREDFISLAPRKSEETLEGISAPTVEEKPRDQEDKDDVEIRASSPRKISGQDRPRLDKSQSTPAYESVVRDSSSFEEKLRDIRLRKQSRVSEEDLDPPVDVPSHSPTPSPVLSDAPRLSPKPALPPRNKARASENDPLVDSATSPSSPSSGQDPSATLPGSQEDSDVRADGISPQEDQGLSADLPSCHTPPHELTHLGLRPHEIRDLIRRGLWPRHPTDEDKALPALTRVTRLDSNFDPVPGSTVPRIAPSLLLTTFATARLDEEEVHVALPLPVSSTIANRVGVGGSGNNNSNTHHSPLNSGPVGRTQYHHLQRHSHFHHQQQQQQPGRSGGSPVDGSRRVPCRELGEGDCQGWLSRRRQTRGFWSGPRWIRRFFVLKRHTLYGYRDPEDKKAESLICLPGFSSAPANEVKSKKFAFKIFNPGTVFYFACETKEELDKWLNSVMQSATASYSQGLTGQQLASRENLPGTKGVYYSETEDESFEESESHQTSSISNALNKKEGAVPAELALQSYHSHSTQTAFLGASSTLGRSKKSPNPSASPQDISDQMRRPEMKASWSPMAASLDRKYLKRLLRVAPEKQPVPTPQFRSYRKPSPSPSPTTLSSPTTPLAHHQPDVASTATRTLTDSTSPSRKPPPRPPSDSKPASPFKLATSILDQNKAPSFDFPPAIHSAGRHSIERATLRENPLDSTQTFRKSMSTSKLSSGQQQQHLHLSPNQLPSPMALPADMEKERNLALPLSQRRSINRRHSIEITDSNKQSARSVSSPLVKPQLAPKPNIGSRTLGRPSSSSLASSPRDRPLSSSLNRGSREVDQSTGLESGYAKIKPRQSNSNASDYVRSPTRAESVGRRSSIGSSRRSSADGSVKSTGNSGSLSRLPCRTASISPLSPSKGVFNFNQENDSKSYRAGPPDQLWINSLRGGSHLTGPPPVAPKPNASPVKSSSQSRLKSAACYQPMNFPMSPKDESKMKAAFEMNLDLTLPNSSTTETGLESKSTTAEAKSFFKMLVSPKFGRKTPSPLVLAKNKSTAAEPCPSSVSPILQKTLLGSPRLHRAIFGTPKDKRKKLQEENERPTPNSAEVLAASSIDGTGGNDSFSSFNSSSMSSDLSPSSCSPSLRSLHRPPLLISPSMLQHQQSSPSSGAYDDGSCPGTPKTPLLKPAMGVSMIGKQRRTPQMTDSPFGPPQSPPLNPSGGLLRATSVTPTSAGSTTHFTYTLTPKEATQTQHSAGGGELEYPPIFEPGTYSLSSATRSSALPPVPAPRTKFLTSSSTGRLSHSPSIDTTNGSSNTTASKCQQHQAQVFLDDLPSNP